MPVLEKKYGIVHRFINSKLRYSINIYINSFIDIPLKDLIFLCRFREIGLLSEPLQSSPFKAQTYVASRPAGSDSGCI